MPAGRVRVNQEDPEDGSLEFIGEDVLDHTPRNESVLLKMGNAFDVLGERAQIDFKVDHRTRDLWETFEIKLRNHVAKIRPGWVVKIKLPSRKSTTDTPQEPLEGLPPSSDRPGPKA